MSDKTSVRTYPKGRYGTMPHVDQFIERPSGSGANLKAEDRYKVDEVGFPNLTKAREHVIATLEISNSFELGREIQYTPATGWKTNRSKMTKGNTMGRAVQSVEEAIKKVDAAKADLDRIQGIDASGYDEAGLAAHKREIKKAQDRVSYYKGSITAAERAAAIASNASKPAEVKNPEPPLAVQKETIRPPAAQKDSKPQSIGGARGRKPGQQATQPRQLTPEPSRGFDVSITTKGGSSMSIKCTDDHSLDTVFTMIKKHGM